MPYRAPHTKKERKKRDVFFSIEKKTKSKTAIAG